MEHCHIAAIRALDPPDGLCVATSGPGAGDIPSR
jgi:hypothetical protein